MLCPSCTRAGHSRSRPHPAGDKQTAATSTSHVHAGASDWQWTPVAKKEEPDDNQEDKLGMLSAAGRQPLFNYREVVMHYYMLMFVLCCT